MSVLLRERSAPHEGVWSRLDQRGRIIVILGLSASVAFMGAQGSTLSRALVGLFGLLVFTLIAFSGRDTALVMVVVWLVLLGFVRRFLIPFTGWAEQDPLLLVSPAAAITFLLAARGQIKPPKSALAALALFLVLWSGLQVFNPNEPGLVVAFQGAMFWVVPMLWFFVGRTLTDVQHERIVKAVMWVAVVVVAHGLYQTFVTFLPFEYTWVGVSNQNEAIFLAGFRIRPFSTLTSPQEYGQFLSFALMIVWGRILYYPSNGLRRNRRWLTIFLVVIAVALFYQGTRSIFLFTVVAFAVTAVVRFRSPLLLIVVLMAGFGMMQWISSQDVAETAVAEPGMGAATSDQLATRTLSGLTNPGESTLPMHMELIQRSFGEGLRNPFGAGVSQRSIASTKAGTANGTLPAENDIATTMESLGTPGGLAYIGFIVAGFAAAVRMQRRRPSARHLAWLGMLVAALTHWWSGGLYATSTVLFLALGGLSRESGEATAADQMALYARARAGALAGAVRR